MPTLDDALSRNSIHAVAGSPHAGKSTLLAHLTGIVLGGHPQFLGLENDLPSNTRIVYVLADRPWHDSGRWLEQRGLANSKGVSLHPRLTTLPLVDNLKFLEMKQAGESGSGFFSEFVQAHCDPGALVILDTATVFVGDVLRARDVMPNIDRLRLDLHGKGIRLVLVVYGVKVYVAGSSQNYAHLVDRVIGCADFRGALSTCMYTGLDLKHEDAPRHLQIATRRNALLTMRVGLNAQHELAIVHPVTDDGLLQPAKPPAKCLEFLLLLPDEVSRAGALHIADEHDIAERTAEWYLRLLLQEGLLTSDKRGCYRKVKGN